MARYDDMLVCAAGLDRLAGEVIARAGIVKTVAASADVLGSAPLSPMTAAQVEASVAAATVGPKGMLTSAAQVKASAVRLRVAVQAYQTLDATLAAAVTGGQQLAAFPALLGAAGQELPRAWWDWQTLNFSDLGNIPGLMGSDVMGTLYENPWIVDGVINDAPGLLGSLSFLAGPWGTLGLSAFTWSKEGTPFPPTTLQQGTGDLVAFGGLFGLFNDGRPGVQKMGDPRPVNEDTGYPQSLERTMAGINRLGEREGSIRVFQVTGADGVARWVVEIPGTQEWSPTAGSNPVDLTTNARLMAGQQPTQNQAIVQAMHQAGIQPGDPVMLAGHSQGGIAAASLAADPGTRAQFNITNVYTGGSPIARFDIPDTVHVMSVEHTQDAVPRLDGTPNPDRPTWVTVTHDPTGMAQRDGTTVTSTAQSHDSYVYSRTAGMIDASTDPTLVAARQSFDPFFTGDPSKVTYQDFQLTRQAP